MFRIALKRPWALALRPWQSPWRESPFDWATKISLATVAKDATSSPSSGIRLRGYQEECVRSVLTAIHEGRRQVGVSLATGSGKTVIFTELIGRVPGRTVEATQTLILVHRRELVEQAARHCESRYPHKTVDIEMWSMHASGHADVTIASVQSINSRDRIEKFDPSRFKLVLVDEAHHIVASGYLRVLDYFGLLCPTIDPTPALVGVSATLSRFDGLALGKAIKHIVYHKDYVDMIGEKWLSDVVFTTVKSNADVSKVKKGANGDFHTGSLSKAVRTNEVNLITVRAWQTRAANRKSTIIFCVDLAHVDSLTNAFRTHGIDARFVTGDTPKTLRSERLEAFKNREYPVLLNCGVFTEGTDIPNIDCVVLARPTKSRNLLVQMIGRGMRLYNGKADCHIIDMVASLESGIVTTPTLFGLDPDELIDNASAQDMENARKKKEQERLNENDNLPTRGGATMFTQRDISGKITFTDYGSVDELIDDDSVERYIGAISQHTWVNVGEDRYVLANGPTGSFLVIEREADLYTVRLNSRLADSADGHPIFARPRIISTSEKLESAVHGADTYASKHFTRNFISRYTPGNWRAKPASDAQVAFLNKFRTSNAQLTPNDITKGKAGDMITKIKFGARGRFKKATSAKKRAEKDRTKRDESDRMLKRELVQVGPLTE